MHGRGVGVQGRGGCAWQGVGMHGGGVCGGGHARQGRRVWQGGMHGRKNSNCSGQYASYCNAFLTERAFVGTPSVGAVNDIIDFTTSNDR